MTDKELKKMIRDNFTISEQSRMRETERFHKFVSSLPVKSKPRFRFRPRFAFMTLLLFVVVVSLGIIVFYEPNNTPTPTQPSKNIEEFLNPKTLELNYLIYSGVSRSFEANSFKQLNNFNGPLLKKLNQEGETAEELTVDHYPFGYLRINDPLSFYIYIEPGTNDFIEGFCGSGEIEVVVCEVHFYDEAGGYIQDEFMIIFKGVYGIYSCLTNGASWNYENSKLIKSTYEFSSHKYISGNEIIKDLGMNNIIRVVVDKGVPVSLQFEDFETHEVYNHYEPYSPKGISCSELYTLSELFTFGCFSFETRITGIEGDLINIANVEGVNLVRGQFDENTEINPKELEIGQFVKITYLKYYEEYNPRITYLYKIDVLDNFNHTVYREFLEDGYQIISIQAYSLLENQLNILNQLIDLIKIEDFYLVQKDDSEFMIVFVIDDSEVEEGVMYEPLDLQAIINYAYGFFGFDSIPYQYELREYKNTLIFIFPIETSTA